ncbi:MAG: hypothetical protein FJW88_01895 [Actinobacteria bacterium]|nr:hypothetical protein [Actinomycetota bacterium]
MAWRRQRARAEELRALELELATIQIETLRAELLTARTEADDTRAVLAQRDGELSTLVERVAATCERLEARADADRAERQALAEALTRIAETLAVRQVAPGPASEVGARTVIGGSVHPAEATALRTVEPEMPEPAAEEPVIVLPDERLSRQGAAPLGAGDECSVRFRFDNRWIDGFEICETMRQDGHVRYRLRRRLDGWVLPELFEAADVRRFDHAVADVLGFTD